MTKRIKSILKVGLSFFWRAIFSSLHDFRYPDGTFKVNYVQAKLRHENKIIHSVWVGKKLSLLECLTIRLLQMHGHEVHLWCYENIENIPRGVILKDAQQILPKETIFEYQGVPFEGLPNKGIGSLSLWSDQFQMELLYKEGGIYTQLDVAYLAPLDFRKQYLFTPWGKGYFQSFLMKCPKGSGFAKFCSEELRRKINKDTIRKLGWGSSLGVVTKYIKRYVPFYKFYTIPYFFIWDLGGKLNKGPFFEGVQPPKNVFIIHWSNATLNECKNNPIKGSYYERLLKYSGIL